MTFATLRALHAVIGSAIDEIEQVYHDRSRSKPLDYPSLDVPYYKTEPHTPAEKLAEDLKLDPDVVLASQRIVAACEQLGRTVNNPSFGLMEDMLAAELGVSLGFLEAASIVEILRESESGEMHVQDIFRSVMEVRGPLSAAGSPLTPSILSHILRLLATSHYLREVKPDVFANNRLSSFIDSGKTVAQIREIPSKKYVDTDGLAAYVGMTADHSIKNISYLVDWAFPDHLACVNGAQEHHDPKKDNVSVTVRATKEVPAPFCCTVNTKLRFFEWLDLPENYAKMERFGHAMKGARHLEPETYILEGFSWEYLPQGSTLVDVGGGIGSSSIIVAEAHPHIQVVVEDTPPIVSTARSMWGPRYAHLFESGRMSYRARDFFQAWTPLNIRGAGLVQPPSVFLVHLVLHDWDDDEARQILTHLRAAAGPQTKLLIGDLLLPYACAPSESVSDKDLNGSASLDGSLPIVPADSPLLSNLGKANSYAYALDILMLASFGAKERTVDEMKALALSAGWKVTEIRRTPTSLWAYTTAVPV